MFAFIAALFTVTNVAQMDAALLSAQNGDRIYMQAGTYAPASPWVISKSLEIFGDGPGEPGHAGCTLIQQFSNNTHVFVVQPSPGDATTGLENVYIHDMQIVGSYVSGSPGTGDGIRVIYNTGPDKNVDGFRMARVMIRNVGHDGIHIEGGNLGALCINNTSITDCLVTGCGGSGLWQFAGTGNYILGSLFVDNRDFGVYAEGCPGFRMIASSVGLNSKVTFGFFSYFAGQIRFKLDHGFLLVGNHIEEFDNNSDAENGIIIENCFGGVIEGNYIVQSAGAENAGSRGILIESLSRSIQVGSNNFANVDTLVKVETDKSPAQGGMPQSTAIILPQGITEASDSFARALFSIPTSTESGTVLFVPTKTGSAGDQEGNNIAGVTLPRITTTTRDALAAIHKLPGLQIFNATSKQVSYWNGNLWK